MDVAIVEQSVIQSKTRLIALAWISLPLAYMLWCEVAPGSPWGVYADARLIFFRLFSIVVTVIVDLVFVAFLRYIPTKEPLFFWLPASVVGVLMLTFAPNLYAPELIGPYPFFWAGLLVALQIMSRWVAWVRGFSGAIFLLGAHIPWIGFGFWLVLRTPSLVD